ncbi:helicase POLQ-like isoform X2 [Brachionus plicatilis]|uniref:Helicase POLQ-like isoform X2 n=1 Tax=Brachionus plicatilis TaxID=10195 RepID=A0A3M7SVD1_BRAPC|nr:helicase POLQ-like isoform X2 [Brachionus plicatilis]
MKRSESLFNDITNKPLDTAKQSSRNSLNTSKAMIDAASNSYREPLVKFQSFDSSSSSQSQKNSQTQDSGIKRAKFSHECVITDFDSQKYFSSKPENAQDKLNSSNDSDISLQNIDLDLHDPATTFYGLSPTIKDLFKKLRNITCLYDWQHELLTIMQQKYQKAMRNLASNTPKDLNTNLLYLSPTSGGKTLVAEMLILHCLLVKQKNVIFIMPFVSIVQEKVLQISDFAEELNFHVEEYAGVKGMIPPLKRQLGKKRTLFVCTIEKAHSLVNSLIEADRLRDEIGLVCADEFHMIGENGRGAIYEMILSKIKYCSGTNSSQMVQSGTKSLPIQIVATTATLENKLELASFLNAYLYERNFRPVELKEYVKMDKQIFEVDKNKIASQTFDQETDIIFKPVRQIDLTYYTSEMKKNDIDGLIALTREVIPNESCLIFCPSKKNCENVASLLATYLQPELKKHKREQKLKLFQELKEENSNNICPVLRQSLQFGIAYHHSGLTTEERQLIEQAYREGILCLITCTSTLAAGVNLPAKRVIIRSPYVAVDFITNTSYRQMIGRAGRAGLIDSVGESILLFKNQDKQKVFDLITGPLKKCQSALQIDSKALRVLVLSLIGLNMTHLGSQILIFIKQTLFYVQQGANMFQSVDGVGEQEAAISQDEKLLNLVPEEFLLISQALDYLVKNKLININNKADGTISPNVSTENLKALYYCNFEITKLGQAAIKGNVDLDLVDLLYNDLKAGLKNMVLANYLHLLYLCTPYDLVNNLNNVDYDIYTHKFGNLDEDEVRCAKTIGISEEYLQRKRFNNKSSTKKVDDFVVKRFYMTLIIYELWKSHNSIWKVSSEFGLDRGFVQQIVQSAASFTSGVLHFCENLDEFWPYKNMLAEFTKRLQFNCSSADLIPLLELEGVRVARAKQLYIAGYKSIEDVAGSNPDDMTSKIKNIIPAVAKKIIKSAKKILKEKIENLQSEADNLLLQLSLE